MLVQRKALEAELPALAALGNTDLCEHLAALGLPVDGVEEKAGHIIIDVDITANRGDACSHLGLARDLGAKLGHPLAKMAREALQEGKALFPVRIESEPKAAGPIPCSIYATAILELANSGQTPKDVVELLACMGSNAKNLPAVDASNEILHRYGHPTHAFDFETLKGAVVVRWGRPGETLVTLDGVERKITGEDLVIADEDGPIALAGVMGGDPTKVTEKTKKVLLESAYFDPKLVRRMAHRHGLHSDASFRFGRGADPAMARIARDLLANRLQSWAGAALEGAWAAEYGDAAEPATVLFKGNTLARVAGEVIPLDEAGEILKRLGCQVEAGARELRVMAPSWRHDLHIEEDFAEEVLRIRGYDRIESALPPLEGPPVSLPLDYLKRRRLASRLAHLGFCQTVTYGFVDPLEDKEGFGQGDDLEKRTLRNPLGEEYSLMRGTLLRDLRDAVELNLNRGAKEVRLFEIAPTFKAAGNAIRETWTVALVWAGEAGGEDPLSPARKISAVEGKSHLAGILKSLGVSEESCRGFGQWVLYAREGSQDQLGWQFEVSLDHIPDPEERVIPSFQPFSRFPAVERDLSLLVALGQEYRCLQQDMVTAVRAVAEETLQDLRCVDVFRHKSLPAGKQAWLIRLRFQAMDRTLTSEEVDNWVQTALSSARTFGAELRG